MRDVELGWRGVAIVCTQCASGPDDPRGAGRELRKQLRDRLRAEGLKGEHLVVNSGCLGVCSDHGVTIAVLAADGSRSAWVVSPQDDLDAVWEQVRARMLSPSGQRGV